MIKAFRYHNSESAYKKLSADNESADKKITTGSE